MSELTERMRRLADQSADYWADIIGSIVTGSTAPGGSTLAARLECLLREAADRIEFLEAQEMNTATHWDEATEDAWRSGYEQGRDEAAEFIGRLPDYVKELEADVERLEDALEWTRQQWVDGEDPMCEDVCEIACKGPCGFGGES